MMQVFSYQAAVRGQEISEETYYEQLNISSPISLKGGQGWPGGFQVGVPYSHEQDARTGTRRALYATFVCAEGRYFFQGYNFAGEVDSRPYLNGPEK